MQVRVMVKYSFHRKYLADREYDKVDLNEGSTIRKAVEHLGISEYSLSTFTVNGEERDLDSVLSDGDSIVIWPRILGGG